MDLPLTDEGQARLPVLAEAFERPGAVLEDFKETRPREVLTVGAVGTFAVGWPLPRLRDFQQHHPFVELRLLTHNKPAAFSPAAPAATAGRASAPRRRCRSA